MRGGGCKSQSLNKERGGTWKVRGTGFIVGIKQELWKTLNVTGISQ